MEPDPRLSGDHVRTVDGPGLTIVGVVHDHPASIHRAAEIVKSRGPDIVALELPPIAVPAFTSGRATGEMAAAIAAAETDRIVGIDGPSLRFLTHLARHAHRHHASLSTVCDLLVATGRVTVRSLAHRLPRCQWADEPWDGVASTRDDPLEQAADERHHLARARSIHEIFESSPASEIRNGARETHMVAELARLRREGSVVAIVGRYHLDRVASGLAAAD